MLYDNVWCRRWSGHKNVDHPNFWCLIMGVTWGNLKEAQESCEKVVFGDGGQMGGLFVTLNNLQLSINVQKL